MTTDERQRIARDFRHHAVRFRDAAGDDRRTREEAGIAARRFITARSEVPVYHELIGWPSGEPVSKWSGADARGEARWFGRWQAIVQALACHFPDRLPPIMPAAGYYPTACDLLADLAEEAGADVDARTLPVLPHADSGDGGHTGPTVNDLVSEVEISDDTFRRVRDAAGIVVSEKGSKARARRYPATEVDRLIAAARDGDFIKRAAMMKKWARWGTAASKPQASCTPATEPHVDS